MQSKIEDSEATVELEKTEEDKEVFLYMCCVCLQECCFLITLDIAVVIM